MLATYSWGRLSIYVLIKQIQLERRSRNAREKGRKRKTEGEKGRGEVGGERPTEEGKEVKGGERLRKRN